ncbi:MAG: hypothetical protein ACO3Z6_14760 [Pseudomonadales bacterium]
MPYNILLLGASYGSLLAAKLLFGRHSIHLVCLPEEARLINSEGFKVVLPIRGRTQPIELASRTLPGRVSAGPAGAVDPGRYDLIGLCMQEPQYCAPGVRELLDAIGRSGVPCMSLMNMPPLPYLKRIVGLDTKVVEAAYTDPRIWDSFSPARMTLTSPDPQAIRRDGEPLNKLTVTLPTNFKCAAFADDSANTLLRQLEQDVDDAAFHQGDERIPLPVKLRVSDSPFTPLAKWAMLLSGNYRCVTKDSPRTVQEAVHSDIETSRSVYTFVNELCLRLGAIDADLVPFEKYAQAAKSLVSPSSAARALHTGAKNIERTDLLVQLIAQSHGLHHPTIDAQVALVNQRLAWNRSECLRGQARA